MRSYETARNLYSFLGFLAWCVVGVGALVAITGFASLGSNASGLQVAMTAAPGVLISLAGVYGLAMVQNGRTSVDCAEYAQQALDVSRKHLELSKQMLEQNRESLASYTQLLRSRPFTNEETSTETNGPSYADRRAETASNAAAGSAPDVLATPTAPTLTASRTEALPNQANEITFRNGQFFVGREPFLTKEAAQERLAVLNSSGT